MINFSHKTSTYQIEIMFYRIKIVCLGIRKAKILNRNNKNVKWWNVLHALVPNLSAKQNHIETKPNGLNLPLVNVYLYPAKQGGRGCSYQSARIKTK